MRLIERVFNVLYMRTASEDLTTRARIRDTAIGVFGSQGFTAGVRSIATAAGVSPGLLNHHFGSKDGLRTACDEHVLRVIRDLAEEGWSMVIVTHEVKFAAQVADQVLFIDQGLIVEQGPPAQVISNPSNPRTQDFLRRILEPI